MTPATAAGPRYRIVAPIGRGGMGEVCLADDLMLHRRVALKFVAAPGERDALDSLLDEARAAAALDHPFICSIYEVTTIDGRPCIAMEYVRGETLDRRLRAGPLPIEEALHVAEEIAEALDAAHKRRIVHRDLKPANVMLTEDGHVKVMDFGLATRLPGGGSLTATIVLAPAAASAVIRGTPAYMAPEQIRGEAADRRSDIFAFGALLYEVLSGAHPFLRTGLDATLAAILAEEPPALRARVPAIPAGLEVLVKEMLAKAPAARSQSFADIRRQLRGVSVERAPAAAPKHALVVDHAASDDSARLIGRDAERAQLLAAVKTAAQGSGALVVLSGEVGIGKTRLAEEALAAARRLGCQTLTGRCNEQEGASPLVPYIEVLEEASRVLSPTVFRQAVGPVAPELAKLLPELHRLFPDMEQPLELPSHLQQRFLFTNIRDFLMRCSRFMPLVIFVDDLQWADESTLALTRYLAQQVSGAPLLVIAAYRDAEPVTAGKGKLQNLLDRVRGQPRDALAPQMIKATLDDLVRQRAARAIALRPFTEIEVRGTLAALGGDDPPGELVRKFVEHTGGNPLFVIELFRHLRDQDRLFSGPARWPRNLDLASVEVPGTLRVVLERRLQCVSADAQKVLKAAAVIGHRFELDLLEAVADVDDEALLAAIEESEQARIVRGPSGRRETSWRFAHPLLCQLLIGAIPRLRRERLHLRIADAMARCAKPARSYASEIAHHLYSAGRAAEVGRTARALIDAGDAAHAVYATDEAILHYRRALEVLQDAPKDETVRADVAERLADLLALVGERQSAMEHYGALVSSHGRNAIAADTARLARKIGTLHWQTGDRGAAMASYRRALDALGDSTAPIEAAHLYHELGLAAFRSGDNRQAIEWAERALQSAELALADASAVSAGARKAATAAIAHATNTIGVALARSGQLDAARDRIERSLTAAQEAGLLEVACRAYANLGVLYSTVQPSRAIEVSRTGLEVASRIGAASLQSYIYANLAAAYCALTDRCETEGLQAAQTAARLDRELGQLDHLAVPLVVMAQIHQCRGELQKADDEYREALAVAEQIGEPQLIVPCYDGLATICLDRGDRNRAEEYMSKARDLCERSGLDPDSLMLLPFLC